MPEKDSVQMSFDFFDDIPVDASAETQDNHTEDSLQKESVPANPELLNPFLAAEDEARLVANPAESDAESVPEPVTAEKEKKTRISESLLARAALAFLASQKPACAASGVALSASVRRKFPAAAFWLESARTDNPVVSRIAVCEVSLTGKELFAEDSHIAKLNADLQNALSKKDELEAKIRETEPLLNDSLFSELREWNYAGSKNRSYHACLKNIEKLRFSLAHTGKLDKIAAEQPADSYYLIAPAGTIDPNRLPAEWGLVELSRDWNVVLTKAPAASSVEMADGYRNSAALRIASTVKDNVLFANGISLGKDGITLHPLPHRRRKSL